MKLDTQLSMNDNIRSKSFFFLKHERTSEKKKVRDREESKEQREGG